MHQSRKDSPTRGDLCLCSIERGGKAFQLGLKGRSARSFRHEMRACCMGGRPKMFYSGKRRDGRKGNDQLEHKFLSRCSYVGGEKKTVSVRGPSLFVQDSGGSETVRINIREFFTLSGVLANGGGRSGKAFPPEFSEGRKSPLSLCAGERKLLSFSGGSASARGDATKRKPIDHQQPHGKGKVNSQRRGGKDVVRSYVIGGKRHTYNILPKEDL